MGDDKAYHIKPETAGEKLVIDYLNINIFDVQLMPMDIYLYFRREAYITKLLETQEGREYLENCWRIGQAEPDRESIRAKIKKG